MGWNQTFLNALIVPLLPRIIFLPANIFSNNLSRKVFNNIARNPDICCFASFFVASQNISIFKRFKYSYDIFLFFLLNYQCFCC